MEQVQHLIEKCLVMRMSRDDTVHALASRAGIRPLVTLTGSLSLSLSLSLSTRQRRIRCRAPFELWWIVGCSLSALSLLISFSICMLISSSLFMFISFSLPPSLSSLCVSVSLTHFLFPIRPYILVVTRKKLSVTLSLSLSLSLCIYLSIDLSLCISPCEYTLNKISLDFC